MMARCPPELPHAFSRRAAWCPTSAASNPSPLLQSRHELPEDVALGNHARLRTEQLDEQGAARGFGDRGDERLTRPDVIGRTGADAAPVAAVEFSEGDRECTGR